MFYQRLKPIIKDALNKYLFKHAGGNQRPVFYTIDKYNPALSLLAENYHTIAEEFESIRHIEMPRYHDIDPGEKEISHGLNQDKRWNVFMLELLGHKPEKNRRLCPRTCALLAEIPNLAQAFFSIMEPGKSVPLHKGPLYGYLRYHLGVQIPKENPPKIIVNGQSYTWKEGEGILFDDSWPHEVVNHSAEMRVVLIVDVLRPMAKLPTLVNRFMTNTLARHTYGRLVLKNLNAFDTKPMF